MSKGLESLSDLRLEYCGSDEQKERAYNIIEKELIVMEIIKNRLVDTHDIVIYTFSEFNYRRSQRGLLTISKEEYDLLKEVIK